MPISPIGSISIPDASALAPSSATGAARGADAAGGGSEATGAKAFSSTLDQLATTQADADSLMTNAATGELTDLTAVMSAMTEAQLSTQLTVALRNKAVESFNEIMRMQI